MSSIGRNCTMRVGPEVALPRGFGANPPRDARDAERHERPEQRAAGEPGHAIRDDRGEKRHEGDCHRQAIPHERGIRRLEVIPGRAERDERHRDAEHEIVRCEVRRGEPRAIRPSPSAPANRNGRFETTFQKFGTPKNVALVREIVVRGVLRNRIEQKCAGDRQGGDGCDRELPVKCAHEIPACNCDSASFRGRRRTGLRKDGDPAVRTGGRPDTARRETTLFDALRFDAHANARRRSLGDLCRA